MIRTVYLRNILSIVFLISSILLNVMFLHRWETEVTSTPTRPVENVVVTTKGLQDRNNLLLDGRTVENKGKLILTEYSLP